MFDTLSSRTSRSARRVAAVLAAAVLVPLLSAQPASAVAATSVTGRPGPVTVTLPMLGAYEQVTPQASMRQLATNGMVVGRSSAAAGSQLVSAQYVLQRSVNGRWVNLEFSPQYSGTISGTGTLRFPAWSKVPLVQDLRATGYRFVYNIVWASYTTGTAIAAEQVYSNRPGENLCYTRTRRCTAYTDGVVY